MKIPIEGDKIRIRDGERESEETCFESALDLARAPYGRTLSVLTKRVYRLGSHYGLMCEDGFGLAALVHSIYVPRKNAFARVTFSLTMLPQRWRLLPIGMAGLYSIRNLLDLIEREGAQELWLHVGKPPLMVVRGQMRALDEAPLTKDNTTELFGSVATADQLRELQQCGDIHFIYVSQNSARFGVTAAIQHEEISVKIKNLTR